MKEKIKNNPNSTEDENLEGGDEEEKKVTDEESDEEGNQEEASTDKEPGDDVTKDTETDTDEHSKEVELAALERDRKKISGDTESIDDEITEKKREIVNLRKTRREKREELKGIKPLKEESDDLADISQEDIATLERVLKAKGYVPGSVIDERLYKSTQQAVEGDFFNSNPEYKPENDKDDVLYNALREELALYAAPKNPREVKTLLDRADKFVRERYPSKFIAKKESTSGDKPAQKKKSLASSGAGNSGTSTTPKSSTLTKEQVQELKAGGWSDEDIAEM